MNVDHMQATRDLIAHHHDRFTMNVWAVGADGAPIRPVDLANECGSAGCIAGWAVAAAGEVVDPLVAAARACALLGLDPWQGHDLFIPDGNSVWARDGHPAAFGHIEVRDITAKDAIDMLDRIISGEIQLQRHTVPQDVVTADGAAFEEARS